MFGAMDDRHERLIALFPAQTWTKASTAARRPLHIGVARDWNPMRSESEQYLSARALHVFDCARTRLVRDLDAVTRAVRMLLKRPAKSSSPWSRSTYDFALFKRRDATSATRCGRCSRTDRLRSRGSDATVRARQCFDEFERPKVRMLDGAARCAGRRPLSVRNLHLVETSVLPSAATCCVDVEQLELKIDSMVHDKRESNDESARQLHRLPR